MCPPSCLCATLTYTDVVPLRGDPNCPDDGLNCPSDESLLLAWAEHKCIQCLTWWVERVWIDNRYQQIVCETQQKWPGIAISDLRQDVIVAVFRRPNESKQIDNVPGFFRTLLNRAAYGQYKALEKWHAELEPDASYAAEMEVSATDPRIPRVTDCLKKLSETEHDLIQAFYYQGKSCSQLARALHKTLGAITQQLYRTRTKLRRCVEKRDNNNG